MERPIIIVGAGIVGLDTALRLAEDGYGKLVTIIAEHLPGDTSINYTSPWAGANYSAISGNEPNTIRWDELGYLRLMTMAKASGKEAKLEITPSIEIWDEPPVEEKLNSLSSYLEDFTVLPQSELPAGAKFGISFKTITFNAPAHLEYLKNLLMTTYGVEFLRKKIDHINSAFLSSNTKLVFNCTGNGARTLAGVTDTKCYPTRGQILLTKAPHIKTNMMRHGKDYETYIIPRPATDGHIILGGYMQKNNGSGDTLEEESRSIWTRTTELMPAIKSRETSIIIALAGLRPSREGGGRVELEAAGDGCPSIIHIYGASGAGYQSGHGMAADGVALAAPELAALDKGRAKL